MVNITNPDVPHIVYRKCTGIVFYVLTDNLYRDLVKFRRKFHIDVNKFISAQKISIYVTRLLTERRSSFDLTILDFHKIVPVFVSNLNIY
jgi:phage gp36-like protein